MLVLFETPAGYALFKVGSAFSVGFFAESLKLALVTATTFPVIMFAQAPPYKRLGKEDGSRNAS